MSLKRILLTLFLCSQFVIFYHFQKVRAHESNDPWLFVNNEALIDNPIPITSVLKYTSHIAKDSLEVEKDIEFLVDSKVVKLNFKVGTFKTKWGFSKAAEFNFTEKSGDKFFSSNSKNLEYLELNGELISGSFSSSGTYFGKVELIDSSDEVFEEEEFTFTVGEILEQSHLVVNGVLIDKSNPLIDIVRDEPVKFEVLNPDFEKYNYYLDLGDADLVTLNYQDNLVTKGFLNSKLPKYIILRKEDKVTKSFADSFVRLDSRSESEFKVVGPATPLVNDNKSNDNNAGSKTVILTLIFTILIIAVGVSFYIYTRKSKTV